MVPNYPQFLHRPFFNPIYVITPIRPPPPMCRGNNSSSKKAPTYIGQT